MFELIRLKQLLDKHGGDVIIKHIKKHEKLSIGNGKILTIGDKREFNKQTKNIKNK